jgi:hypothetical protein
MRLLNFQSRARESEDLMDPRELRCLWHDVGIFGTDLPHSTCSLTALTHSHYSCMLIS